jgi:sugar/nucleoside kinase (ribokinase family)
MSGGRIVVVGDIVNDVVVIPRGEIRHDTDTPSTIRPRPGGSAANTAAWLGSRGAPVDFVGCVGATDADHHSQTFRDHGVVPHLQVETGLPTGTIVIIVEGEQRTMLTERGANAALSSATVTDELLAAATILLVSGYSILDGFSVRGVRDLIERAQAAGVRVAVTLGSVGYLHDFGPDAFQAAVEGAELAFLNLDEGRLLTGEVDVERVALRIADRFERAVITIGSEGVVVIERGQPAVRVPAPAVRMVDPTGAGDAFAAGFLANWIASGDMVAAAGEGVFVAARAIMVMGGRPPV